LGMKKARWIMGLTTAFFWASEYCHVPFFTPYLRTLGLTATVIGFLVGCYGFTQLCIRVPLGIFADLSSRYKWIVMAGCFFTTVSSIGLYLTQNVPLMFFFRILAGVAASTWVGFTILYTGYFSPDEGQTAIAQINAYNNAGKLLAFFLGSAAAMLWGYRAPLLMSCLTGLVAVACSFFIQEVHVKREPQSVRALLRVFGEISVLVPALLAIFQQMMIQATAFSFTSEVARTMGARPVEIGVSSCLFTATQILTAGFVSSGLARRLGSRPLLTCAFTLLALYCAMVGFAQNMWILYIAQIVAGFSAATLYSVLTADCIKYIDPGRRSTAMGFYQAIYGAGMTAGPILMGRFIDLSGMRPAFYLFGGISLFAAVLALALVPIVTRKYQKAPVKS
jgi:MFS family permease